MDLKGVLLGAVDLDGYEDNLVEVRVRQGEGPICTEDERLTAGLVLFHGLLVALMKVKTRKSKES